MTLYSRHLDIAHLHEDAKAAGYSMRELARRLNVPWSTFWQWQAGKMQMPKYKIDELCELLETEGYVDSWQGSTSRLIKDGSTPRRSVQLATKALIDDFASTKDSMRNMLELARYMVPTMDNFRHPKARSEARLHRDGYIAQLEDFEYAQLPVNNGNYDNEENSRAWRKYLAMFEGYKERLQ